MSLFLTDFDQWYDQYEAASPSQHYEMVKAAIAEPIPISYSGKIDFGEILIDVWGALLDHNQVDECLALITTLQQQQPHFYQQEFEYLDDFLVKYHLFHHQIDTVRNDLSRFQANPIKGIDQFGSILDDLQFYGAIEPLVDLCRAVYQPVATSHEVLSGAEIKFGYIIIFDLFERAYQQLQLSETTIDWDPFKMEASQYGLGDNASKWAEIQHHLTVEVETGEKFAQQFKRDLGSAVRHLLLNFCRHMQTQHQMSFVGSRAIWESILDFLEAQEPSKKQRVHPDGYFAIDSKKLNLHLGQKVAGLLSMQQAQGVAIVWGLPYVYDFLQSKQIVSEAVAEGAIAIAQSCKPQLIKALQTYLWQFDFVHRWPRPDSLPEAEFAAEAEQFAASIEQATPLSDEPNPNPIRLSLADKETATDSPTKSPQKPLIAKVKPTPQTQAKKPQMRRKSPLQEAKGLSKSNKSGKKKSG